MKYLKMLGLAGMAAAALMAIVGVGAASAETTLCKVTEDACSTTNMYPVGTEIHAQLVQGTHLVTTPEAEQPESTCSKSTLRAKTETTTTPEGKVEVFKKEECNQTTETIEAGKLQIHWDAEHNGTVTLHGLRTRVKAFFGSLSCDFGGTITSGITLTGGSSAKLDITAQVPLIQETGFVECPLSVIWHAEYQVTSPSPLYVSSGV